MIKNIMNTSHKIFKVPYHLVLVDLESVLNNKGIFELKFLYYAKIKIESANRDFNV